MQSEEPAAYQFGEFILDIENRKLIKTNGDKQVELTNQPFNFLVLLLKKNGNIVYKPQIFNEIWEGKHVGEGSLNQLVTTLRNDLNDKEKREIIKNRPGLGYSFGIEVKELSQNELKTLLDNIKLKADKSLSQPAKVNKNLSEDLTEKFENSTEEAPTPIDQSRPLLSQPEPEKAEIESNNTIVEIPNDEESSEKPPTFEEWLGKSRVKWWFRFIVVVTVISSIVSRNNKMAIFIGSTSNILLVFSALAYYWNNSLEHLKLFRPLSEDIANDSLKPEVKAATKCRDKLDWEMTRDNAKEGSGIFRVCWQILLIIWVFLYALLAFKTKDNYLLGLFTTFFNNLNTLLLAICFYTFNTLEKGIKELRESSFWIVGFVLIVLLALAEWVALHNSSSIYGIIKPILGEEMMSAEDEISWFFRVISGLGGAIALALFIGRLQSKFFNPAPKFTVIFYSYIAIQPLFVFFDDKSVKMQFVTAIVIHIAVALKYFLFLYLFWAFETGRLLFYLVRVRQTNIEVEEEWQNFQTVLEKNAS
jgi:DNA-binding winged helix-turn-helix (wHTH) protein